MADVWYIDAAGQVEGPVSLSELRVRAADGRLRSADSVSGDRVNWVPARLVVGLTFPPSTVVHAVAPEPAPAPRNPMRETVVSGRTDLNSPPAEAQATFSPLDSVPGYDVQGILGTGACGVVFRAVQVKLNRVVALKTVRMAENTSSDVVARFEQEAVSLARLQHPNIVAVYDCGHIYGRAFFAMELLEGEDLGQRLERAGPLDERTAWLVARQTAAALAHAANLGIIHRDVKPANLFLVPPPTGFPLPPDVPMVKVTDFGLALARSGPGDSDHRQTAAGVVLGTPIYMAPEQFTGSNVDPRADIYSLGATVYHILTGHPPFDGRTVWEVMMKKSNPAPRLEPPVSVETADLVAAMLAVKSDERPADYAELIARIDSLPCVAGVFSSAGLPAVTPTRAPDLIRSLPVPQATTPARGRAKWVYALAAAALLGAAAGVAALAGAFDRASEAQTPNPEPAKPANYVPNKSERLATNTVIGWQARGWYIEEDSEGTSVLAGVGEVARPLPPYPNFLVILAIDPHQANTVEVIAATSDGPPESATRLLVRLDRKAGVAFGKQVGLTGAFEPVGVVLPFPAAKKDQAPYLEVKYQHAGGGLEAWFAGRSLGQTPDAGRKTPRLHIEAKDGPIRIQSVDLVELVEQK